MTDLFRYIEHGFAVPARADAIEIGNGSDFQLSLDSLARRDAPRAPLREAAAAYLAEQFPTPVAEPLALGKPLAALPRRLRKLEAVDTAAVREAAEKLFERTPANVVAGADFGADRELLENAVLAVKLTTGFALVDSRRLVKQLRAAALLSDLVDGLAELDRAGLDALLARPLRIPAGLLEATRAPSPARAAPARAQNDGGEEIEELRSERDALLGAYEAFSSLPAAKLEAIEVSHGPALAPPSAPASGAQDGEDERGSPFEVRISAAALDALAGAETVALAKLEADPRKAPMSTVVEELKDRLRVLSDRLLPLEVGAPARVFRVGTSVFAVRSQASTELATVEEAPDFTNAVTRPVGVGDLLVVRQKLLGYEPGDVSHIENVLEGELLRRSTRRAEISELTLTDELETTQARERDQQSTSRNELAGESQKEASHQATTVSGQMSATDYGRLVENAKTNFAQTVTQRAVDSVTQRVRRQRVDHERKVFVERARHEFDNRASEKKVRGVYQWLDKRYEVKVLNYGRRLMYDVVVPEPAAFLLRALEESVQPEGLQLAKPPKPTVRPSQLNEFNYAGYAALYGATGSVSPPPAEHKQTVAEVRAITLKEQVIEGDQEGNKEFNAHHEAFKLRVPEGYRAVSGYIQRVNPHLLEPPKDRRFEFFVGESNFVRFVPGTGLRVSFTMNDETGDIPVTMRSFEKVSQFTYAVGVNCRRTEETYEEWQLKTHAAIVAGYERQQADYEDKLRRYAAAMGSFAHDPTVEQEELKKAFVSLLLGEHAGSYPSTPTTPWGSLPDPAAVRDWGAVVAFFERAFEWENLMYVFHPYFWGRPARWGEMVLTRDANPQFEAFLKAGAARVVVPVRPGFEAALAHFHETGDVWMGEEIPDMFGENYVSIIAEIKAANRVPGEEQLVESWRLKLPTTLVRLKADSELPTWAPAADGTPAPP